MPATVVELIKALEKFKALIVSPWDGNSALVEIGPSRVGIAESAKNLPETSEFHLYPKNLSKVLERDVWDIPSLLDGKLITQKSTKKTSAGAFRPFGKVQRVIYPTGLLSIDSALMLGGFLGKMCHRLWGASNGGKSVILNLTCITAWEMYRKKSLIINSEFTFDEERFMSLTGGREMLEEGGLEVYEPGNGTDAYNKAEQLVSSGDYAIIGFDSITPLQSPDEMSRDMGERQSPGSKAALQARFIENILPNLYHRTNSALIMIIQNRHMGAGASQAQANAKFDLVSGAFSGQKDKPASGDAVQFYVQQSLKINAPSKMTYDDDGNVTGHRASGFVDKNHHAPMGKKFEFNIDYYNGIDTITDIAKNAVRLEVVQLDRNKHVIPDNIISGGLSFPSAKKFSEALTKDRELRRMIYLAVIEKVNPKFDRTPINIKPKLILKDEI